MSVYFEIIIVAVALGALGLVLMFWLRAAADELEKQNKTLHTVIEYNERPNNNKKRNTLPSNG